MENSYFHIYIDKENDNEFVHVTPLLVVFLLFTDSFFSCIQSQIDSPYFIEDDDLFEDSIFNYFEKKRLYVHSKLYNTIRNYLLRNDIQLAIEELCILACYFQGVKKSCITTSGAENFLNGNTQDILETQKALFKIQSKISKQKNSQTRLRLLYSIKRFILEFNESFELDLSVDSSTIKKEKTDKKVFLEVRRIVAKIIHELAKNPFRLKSKSRGGISSETERKTLGLFYWLLNLHLKPEEFLRARENPLEDGITYSPETVRKDIKYVSGNFQI